MTTPVRYAVIPLAGYGTRMFPWTKTLPKALLPIVQGNQVKPVLQVVVEEALSAGIERICLVCSPDQVQDIREYFNTTPRPVYREKFPAVCDHIATLGELIDIAIQPAMRGFGDAVLCAKDIVGCRHPVLVMLGDHVYVSHEQDRTCAQQLLAEFDGKISVTSLDICPLEEVPVNGLVVGSQISDHAIRVAGGFEKPTVAFAAANIARAPDGEKFYCFFGMDLLSPAIFEALEALQQVTPPEREIQLRDAMFSLATREGMVGVRIRGRRLDTGMPDEYAEAVRTMHVHCKEK